MQRPMDQVTIRADSPQEDEFALTAMGVPSVYRGFLDPRRLPELKSLLDPIFWAEADPSWLKKLEDFWPGAESLRENAWWRKARIIYSVVRPWQLISPKLALRG